MSLLLYLVLLFKVFASSYLVGFILVQFMCS